MIEAVAMWLETQFPTVTFLRQSLRKSDPQKYVLIIDTGGTKEEYPFPKTLYAVQIIVNDVTDARARKIAVDIFDFIAERYETTLSDGNSDFKFAKIRAIDRPFPLGNDGEGFQYSINYEFLSL